MNIRGQEIMFERGGIRRAGVVKEEVREGVYSVAIKSSKFDKEGDAPVEEIILVSEAEMVKGRGNITG